MEIAEVRKEMERIVKYTIADFKNGFRSDLINDLRRIIEQEVSGHMVDVWDRVANATESKITNAITDLRQQQSDFQKLAGDKLDHFTALIKGVNENAQRITKHDDVISGLCRSIERHCTMLERMSPTLNGHEKRINHLEDLPGSAALSEKRFEKQLAEKEKQKVRVAVFVGVITLCVTVLGALILRYVFQI